MYKIEIHRKEPTTRNPQVVIAALVESGSDAGTWHRVFRNRKIDAECLLERDMMPDEVEYFKKCWRLHWWAYTSWKGLIIDEWETTQNLEWIKQLYAHSGISEPLESFIENLKA